jgi:hypothetical protein
MLSAFDDATLDAAQGAGWSPTTDRIAGGASEVTVLPDAPGAGASRAALRIAGTVAPGAPWPWAGALYSPGAAPMQAVDGRAIREIVFQARGDGREYAVLLFSGAQGGLPAMQAFVAGPDWREVRIPLEGFRGADPGQLRGFAITAGLPHGAFALEVDAVELR